MKQAQEISHSFHTDASQHGYVRVDLHLLRELLRLPQDVTITGVRASVNGQCIVDISSKWLPAAGELRAEYGYVNTTLVTFKGFKSP